MNKITFLFFLCLNLNLFSQNITTIGYKPNLNEISNPERGFYRHVETSSIKYVPLVASELVNFRLNNNNSLILRLFYLENFIDSPISDTYLNAIKTDFETLRQSGLKCILRFAYSKKTGGVRDATKARILEHIAQLKPILTANADVISIVQAGFIGTWGEWYYTSNFGMKPTAVDYSNRKEVVTALLGAIPAKKMIQLRTPLFKQKILNTTSPIAKKRAYTTNPIARIGHFNDCFLASATDNGTYSDVIKEYPYLEAETKYVPMGGETCDLNAIRTNCTNALGEMDRFHWSFMNLDYHPDVIKLFKDNACFDEISNRLGYRFELIEGNFPNTLTAVQQLSFNLTLVNKGFATTFYKKQVALILRNRSTGIVHSIDLDTDTRLWDKANKTFLSYNLDLPTAIQPGMYDVLLHIADESNKLKNRPEYAIQLGNSETWEPKTGYNKLQHTIMITDKSGAVINSFVKKSDEGEGTESKKIVINPIPADQEFVIELEDIASYEIVFYNTIGQVITVDKSIRNSKTLVFDSRTMKDGTYLVEFSKDQVKEFKKIVIEHK